MAGIPFGGATQLFNKILCPGAVNEDEDLRLSNLSVFQEGFKDLVIAV
jgi:hypothetical protein